jgi:putative acetyltransferase
MPQTLSQNEITELIKAALPAREITLIGDPAEGYLSLNPANGMIGALYLDRCGQGLGRVLLDHAKQGRDFLQLWTHEPNLDAHRFYEREGFQRSERNPKGNDGLAELRMEWHR